ncbi:MAG: histidine phosphatase family protein [Opitutales bacterium]|nr:histidine phosphatase family protein [Opitutales bacterium]
MNTIFLVIINVNMKTTNPTFFQNISAIKVGLVSRLRFLLLPLLAWTLMGVSVCEAGLKIYYIRHAEGGHNVKKEWEAKGVPESEWPSYVGNPDMFTPKGKLEVVAATESLKAYHFDFIASSPLWRARNTILPYMKLTGNTAEVWPELREGTGMSTILSKDIPDVHEEILNQGKPIILPEEEQGWFMLRNDATNNYSKYPSGSDENAKVAYMKHASLNAIEVIKKRFGGTEKSILLAGHNSAGVSLLKLLLQGEPEDRRGLKNTGIWMVEQQDDGSFELRMYNSVPIADSSENDGEMTVRFDDVRADLSAAAINGQTARDSDVTIALAADGLDIVYSFSIENQDLDGVGDSNDSLLWDIRFRGYSGGMVSLDGNDSSVTLGSSAQVYSSDKYFGVSDSRYVGVDDSIQFSVENVALISDGAATVQFNGFDGLYGSDDSYLFGVGNRGLESKVTTDDADFRFTPQSVLTLSCPEGKFRVRDLTGSFTVSGSE